MTQPGFIGGGSVRIPIPICATCGRKLSKHNPSPGIEYQTMDGQPPARGFDGNNLVCSMRCGYELARAIVQAEPAILALLPAGWNVRSRARLVDRAFGGRSWPGEPVGLVADQVIDAEPTTPLPPRINPHHECRDCDALIDLHRRGETHCAICEDRWPCASSPRTAASRRTAPADRDRCATRTDGEHQWRPLEAGDVGMLGGTSSDSARRSVMAITPGMRRGSAWRICQPCGALRWLGSRL